MLNYHIYDILRSYLRLQKLTIVLYKKNKKNIRLLLNHDNHKLTMVVLH